MASVYFDDFAVGESFASPGMTLSESQIIDFAMRYDPQPFHTNVEAGKQSIFGGLVASGIHTVAITFRLLLMTGMLDNNLGSPGFDEMRWLKPVRPGDTLYATAEVLDTKPSQKYSDRGTIRFRYAAKNQHGEEVFSVIGIQIVRRRPA
ncbi:MAG: MaoC family dehydratase [Deltaproteobacteria bacterium]|nr:MaoC family dehydratase [Deltaproteobacteria bacterium]MBN2686558.1 MaoC family dehydratase [Deltaproteobacteria bacterium]